MKLLRMITMAMAFLMLTTAPLAADTHLVFKSKMIFFGRERAMTWESWAGEGKRYRKTRQGIVIVRNDLGLRWILDPGAKTFTEMLLAVDSQAVKNAPREPDRKNEKEDLRFAGQDYVPVFEWKIGDAEATETRQGLECRRHRLIGDADYSHVELIVWVAVRGKDKGLDFVPEILGAYRRNFDAGPAITGLLERYPEGGIADLQATLELPFGSDMLFSVGIESLEESAAPAGIYEIPADFKKGK